MRLKIEDISLHRKKKLKWKDMFVRDWLKNNAKNIRLG